MSQLDSLRHRVRTQTHADEDTCIELALSNLSTLKNNTHLRQQALYDARKLVSDCRMNAEKRGTLDAFLQEFGLTNEEGLALMCIAESLLRIPDADTADAFIAEKIRSGNWQTHLGHSKSLFVNASTWGLVLTGKFMNFDQPGGSQWFSNILNRLGEPVVRKAMLQAMKILGGQYVLGRTIDEAIKRGAKVHDQGARFSYDMLGEGARTQEAANQYYESYASSIKTLGQHNSETNIYSANGISIKLSALHPRFETSHIDKVKQELFPRVLALAVEAQACGIGLNIDAEESERLDATLEIFQMLAEHESLRSWNGLGFVLQAYQKRALTVVDWLATLAESTQHRFMVRLVKGAYWDREIKFSQENGFEDYPVFTRKANTDLNYVACAIKLLEYNDKIFPQFATHNAYTLALVNLLAKNHDYELQRLHGMGQLVFDHLLPKETSAPAVRIYAPVGPHKELLPYLVRRLLENGANSSFVHYFLNDEVAIDELVQDIFTQVANYCEKTTESKPQSNYRHRDIPLPANIFQTSSHPRINSKGLDLQNPDTATSTTEKLATLQGTTYEIANIIDGIPSSTQHDLPLIELVSPAANGLFLGLMNQTQTSDIESALSVCHKAQKSWDSRGVHERAAILENIANELEEHSQELLHLISVEAGRTLKDAHSEIREAIDFCRYYAKVAISTLSPQTLAGPTGENNTLTMHGRGTFVCISPWNFPAAIFTGQVVAALVAGNAVIAKPAEQTSIVATKIVERMHAAGIPKQVLQLIVGNGARIGQTLISDTRVSGIAFTGSTETAKIIQRQLAERDGEIIPLIAETGGQNAMLVDSSALAEQVVDDIIQSAFYSAGQRCSALRVLFVQQEIADTIITMLCGACEELVIGKPWEITTDIGPVIDKDALTNLNQHIDKMNVEASSLYRFPNNKLPEDGYYLGPHIFEIDSITQLEREVFGPILHIVRFSANEIDKVIEDINNTRYGLTLGIHSRLENRAKLISRAVNIGNVYVNRNMVGAVVGVNPFGGQGLSGTGPKAGGPHYLLRFASEKTFTINTVATGGNTELLSLRDA